MDGEMNSPLQDNGKAESRKQKAESRKQKAGPPAEPGKLARLAPV